MLGHVKRAIDTELPLDDALTGWEEISRGLAESSRRRGFQIEKYFDL
jgi:hypothetical protein